MYGLWPLQIRQFESRIKMIKKFGKTSLESQKICFMQKAT